MRIVYSLVCLFALLFANVGQAQQQEQQGKYVNSAAARMVKLVNTSNGDGYSLQNNTFSIGGGWLPQSTEWTPLYSLNLQAGKNYRVIAVGDMDARDVDLQILDSNNNVVASDTLTAPEAIVNYRPTAGGRYTVRIRLYASQGNNPAVCLAVVLSK